MNAITYVRVSTSEQAESGLGLDAQQAAVQAAADRLGATIRQQFADQGVSGSAGPDKRPGLLDAIEALGRGDVLIVAKRDRLARDTFLSAWIRKEVARRGASIHSAAGEGNGEGPEAQLMGAIIDAFAEYERAQIRSRTKAALAAKRRRGERCSRFAPYGFRHQDGRLVEDHHEQAGLQLIQDLARRGASHREIRDRLTAAGFLGRSGRPLSLDAIGKAIKRSAA